MNSDKHPQTADTAHSEPNRAVNGANFIDAQLVYAKSKQSKQQRRKREYYQTKHWQTEKANNRKVTGGNDDK